VDLRVEVGIESGEKKLFSETAALGKKEMGLILE